MTDIIQIISVEEPPLKNKRFRAYFNNNKHIDFGSLGATTYIDGASESTRHNYQARHYWGRQKELIDNLTPSPSLLSMVLLWGYNRDLKSNIEVLNKMWKEKG
jgi:hypothetical protein